MPVEAVCGKGRTAGYRRDVHDGRFLSWGSWRESVDQRFWIGLCRVGHGVRPQPDHRSGNEPTSWRRPTRHAVFTPLPMPTLLCLVLIDLVNLESSQRTRGAGSYEEICW
jgi:hypothetical protein